MATKRIFLETEEVIIRKKRAYIDVEVDYAQMYKSLFNHVVLLDTPVAKDFLLWVVFQADANNMFIFDDKMFKSFIDAVKERAPDKSYSKRWVRHGIKELTDSNIIIRHNTNQYQVNPVLFWRQSTKLRVEAIRGLKSMGIDPRESPTLQLSPGEENNLEEDLPLEEYVVSLLDKGSLKAKALVAFAMEKYNVSEGTCYGIIKKLLEAEVIEKEDPSNRKSRYKLKNEE